MSFLPEPLHEVKLQGADALHIDLCAVGVVESPEHFLHVGFVKDADVPEYGLIAACGGGLVECVNDALKFLLDVVLIRLEVILAVGLTGEVVEHVEELHSCDCPCEVAGNLIDEIHEAAAEALKVLWCTRDAADALCPLQEEGIEGDGGAVGFEAALVVDVDQVVFEVFAVFLGNVLAESLGELGAYLCSVQFDGERFV